VTLGPVTALAEHLPDLSRPRLEIVPQALVAPIVLPPADVVPIDVVSISAWAAIERYAADAGERSRAALVAAVDQVGHRWEHAIASRAVEARAELVAVCRRAVALQDELVNLQASERWLRSFPLYTSWEPEPYSVYVSGHQVAVPELLGAIEDTCAVDQRLIRIAGRPAPHDPPYAPPATPVVRLGSCSARNALAEAGWTLSQLTELMPCCPSLSAVSKWFAGERTYPEALPDVLEDLVGADTAAGILALIPRQTADVQPIV
jgi:hypothetical protein